MYTRTALGVGLVTSLFCGTAATAGSQGLDYRIVTTNAVDGEFNWTVDIILVLDAGERLDAVAGDGLQDKRLTTSSTFFQHSGGGPTSMSINPAFFSVFPSLEYDTFVTVGALDSSGNPYANNALQNIGIDWTTFEGGGDLYTDNGTWFVTPDQPQGEAILFTNAGCEDKYGVVVARVTTFGQDASVFMGALFQGKDAKGTTWQSYDEITITYPVVGTDCNNNGVEDACDILNGTSADANGNGIPDECEFPDCNGNGIDDGLDIADGTSADCNGNGTPDECESGDCNNDGILDECQALDDCDGNGIPDECEALGDCNGNGVPDVCENLQDWDGNGVPDACEGLVAYNTSSGNGYGDFDSAVSGSNDGDVIWVDAAYADTLASMDFHGAAVDVLLLGGGSPSAAVDMADGSSLHVGTMSDLYRINSDTSGTASVASDMHLHSSAVNVFRDASLNLTGEHMVLGNISQRMDSELSLDAPTVIIDGTWTCNEGSTVYTPNGVSMNNTMVGTFNMFGSMTNGGTVQATDDVMITGDLTNDSLVAIHRGVLYVLGNITNNGTIVGEVDPGPGMRGGDEPAEGDGLRVVGNYAAGSGASLYMQHENWRLAVGGNFDVAINDNAQFDMSLATLDLNSHTGQDPQEVEVMSADMGGIEEALDPTLSGAFPFGMIRVSSGATANLVDNHDNDNAGQDLSEVIYTAKLVVEVGATLNTNGYIIYTSDVDNQGTITDEGDIIIINPPMPGDADGDGIVGILDILVVIADWGPCPQGCTSDFNNDGVVDITDILVVITFRT